MITELLQMSNRRIWPRVNRQVLVSAEQVGPASRVPSRRSEVASDLQTTPAEFAETNSTQNGYTLNVSLRGARIVTRQPLQEKFRLRLELDEVIEIDCERMWQEEIGSKTRVAGLRFQPNPYQESVLQAWMEKQAC